MAVVASFDGVLRHVNLLSGVTEFHPIEDIYREYREARRTDEALRKWDPFMRGEGNIAKGGGKFTPRYLVMLDGAKIVPFDEDGTITVTGEVITDDPDLDPDPIDLAHIGTRKVYIKYAPSEAEIIQVATGAAALTPQQEAELSQASDEALLTRKLLDADEDLAADGTWVLKDSDDGVTVLRTRTVTDKSDGVIDLPVGAPAKRVRA